MREGTEEEGIWLGMQLIACASPSALRAQKSPFRTLAKPSLPPLPLYLLPPLHSLLLCTPHLRMSLTKISTKLMSRLLTPPEPSESSALIHSGMRITPSRLLATVRKMASAAFPLAEVTRLGCVERAGGRRGEEERRGGEGGQKPEGQGSNLLP